MSEPTLSRSPSLYDYGVIGNQRTAALVSRDGSIDWACFPRFDSPSLFARILDPTGGGYYRVAPRLRYTPHQHYVHGTNVLTTLFEVGPQQALSVTDFLPIGHYPVGPEGDTRIVRRLQAHGGPVEARIELDVRFDYARRPATWTTDGALAQATGAHERVGVEGPSGWRTEGSLAVAETRVEPGAPQYVEFWWGDRPSREPGPAALLGITDAFWRGWVSAPNAPLRRVAARWHPWVERSELVLKLLSPAGSGVFIAAPTTSLPEWPGAGRNWDYRYVWLRDAAFTAQVFLLLGHIDEARAYVAWALDRVPQPGGERELRVLYTMDGGAPPPEEELPHLAGFLDSRPVRIGNGAVEQRQLDIYGEIVDCAALLAPLDPAFIRDRWSPLERLIDGVVDLWKLPDQGLWEARDAPAHHVHSKLMCWVALDRGLRLAESFGRTEPLPRWRAAAEEVRAAILEHGYDAAQQSFTQAFGRSELDASVLRVTLTGFLPPEDPRVRGTIEAIEHGLGDGPFLRRYTRDDGVNGPEGAFLLCSFWLVEALARLGETRRAMDRWEGLLEAAGPLLLFSEEFDRSGNRPLGNYPQAFTHIGLLRAALALGLVGSYG